MKLVNTTELLQEAREKKFAVPAVNVDNTDSLLAVFEVCEDLHAPVIIQLSPIQAHSRMIGYEPLIRGIRAIGEDYSVRTAIHLDHGTDLNELCHLENSGFSSIMYDGSGVGLEENIRNTRIIRGNWKDGLEGEVGVVGGQEGTETGDEEDTFRAEKSSNTDSGGRINDSYTRVDDAVHYVNETGVDFLAVAIGNAHGIYRREPKLNFERLGQIKDALNIPLVLHGASGLRDTDLARAIALGISKINFFTDLDRAFLGGINRAIRENPGAYSFYCMTEGRRQVENQMRRIIHMCGCAGK